MLSVHFPWIVFNELEPGTVNVNHDLVPTLNGSVISH